MEIREIMAEQQQPSDHFEVFQLLLAVFSRNDEVDPVNAFLLLY